MSQAERTRMGYLVEMRYSSGQGVVGEYSDEATARRAARVAWDLGPGAHVTVTYPSGHQIVASQRHGRGMRWV